MPSQAWRQARARLSERGEGHECRRLALTWRVCLGCVPNNTMVVAKHLAANHGEQYWLYYARPALGGPKPLLYISPLAMAPACHRGDWDRDRCEEQAVHRLEGHCSLHLQARRGSGL